MKVLAIRIKNLASLEGTTEIDFTIEPLCSAGIFAITGPTGAGKSTILDALCLALYAKTPRYLQARESGIEIYDVPGSTISQGDVRGMLRDGTGDGFAEVDFVGIDGQKYSARWSVRRAKNKAGGSLQNEILELKNISSPGVFPGRKIETLKEIERLVGLSFEQFTRSVLLAQGDFTAFLKADKDEKASLLEKLTGSHIYSLISMKVHGRCKSEEQELKDLRLRKEGIHILSEEELHSLATQISKIDDDIQFHEKEVENLGLQLAWHAKLSDLELNKQSAFVNHQQALSDKENATVRQQQLQHIEAVQSIRGKVDALRDTKRQLNEKAAELKTVREKLIVLYEQSHIAKNALTNASADISLKSKAREDALPLIDEAKALDVRIIETDKLVKQVKQDVRNATLNCTTFFNQLNIQKQEANCLLKAINELESWKTIHASRQPVAENQKLIVSKLEDAKTLLEESKGILNNIREANENTLTIREEISQLEKQLAITQKQLDVLRLDFEAGKVDLEATSIDELESGKAANEDALAAFMPALAHWNLLYDTLINYNALKARQSASEADLTLKLHLSEQALLSLNIAQIKKETSGQILEKARLASAKDVAAIRSKLVEGDPCPVCGSTVHPYSAHEVRLDGLLAGIEEEHRINDRHYIASMNELTSLRADCRNLQRSIALHAEEATEKEKALNNLMIAWNAFSVCLACSHIPDDQKTEWMQNNIQQLKTKQSEINEQIRSYNTRRKTLDALQTRVHQFEAELNANSIKIKDAGRTLGSKQEIISRCALEQERNNALLNGVEQTLAPYFVNANWFQEWKSNPETFLRKVNDFAELWRRNGASLDAHTHKHHILSVTISGKEQQYKDLEEEERKRKALDNEVENRYQELLNKRKAIFDGEAVQNIEARLRENMKTAQVRYDMLKADQDALGKEIALAEAGKAYAEKDISVLGQAERAFDMEIKEWINKLNSNNEVKLEFNQVINLLRFSPEWIQQERAALRAVDDAVTETASVLKDRNATLQEHQTKRMSAKIPDELKELYKEQRGKLEAVRSSKNEIDFRLKQDKQNKERIGNLLASIDTKVAIAENWSKLDDIIGSSDGKRFRQIAQEYTLDVLLSYANIQLEMLTKRYRLQRIPNSLALQVLDHDMGNEIRTVYSLSGGESFLVSLALALGLASLSSGRLQVESLFIDEGFGALDPTTLNIAMDALERLQYQGRKVSVISHVEEMTERIPVQIRVRKLSNGKSQVEISG